MFYKIKSNAMKRLVNIIFTVILATSSLKAQEMFISSGSAGKSDKATLSWVIGGGIAQNQNDVSPAFISEVIAKENVALAVKETMADLSVSVYPNPAVEVINVKSIGSDFVGGRIILSDLSGNRVLEENVNSVNTSLYVSSLASGIYMVSAVDKYGKYAQSIKVIKK